MKIAICDDSMKDMAAIEHLLGKYKERYPQAEFTIEKFTNSAHLSEKIQEKKMADIYILDIIMTGTTGIDIGNQIKHSGSEAAIIYITSSDDFALDAYDVHAVRYLLKPVTEDKFFEAMDYARSYQETRRGPLYLVKTRTGMISIPCSKIEYIENSSRMLNVHLTDGAVITSIFIRKSFDDEIRDLITEKSFIQVHKSFLVNLNHIKKLEGNSIIMDNGAQIPVSKKNTASVRRQYLMFISEQYR
ncbi:LytTR family DNA-binding domain-containing protein [Lachnospiraceae bacterium KK002]